MNRVLQYIEEHLEEPLNNKSLAKVAGYSEYHFVRLFKAYTNESAREYVCRRRLIRATEDIVVGMRIIDVALKYGWQSHSAFSKSFHREFGFAPSLLRTMRLQFDCIGGSSMNGIFLRSTRIGACKEELLEILKILMEENGVAVSEKELSSNYRIACKAYEGKRRYSGEEYVTHPMNVAILLTELGANAETVLAGMFCDVAEKGMAMEICNELPQNIWRIVEKLGRKELDGNALDDGVILIKLAERLHNMRTIDFIDEDKRAAKAKETIEIYMPLARRINNQKLMDELNDLAFKYSV